MDENEFEFDNKTYVSVCAGKEIAKCHPCAFYLSHDCIQLGRDGAIPYCDHIRSDGRNVIFVEKNP